VFLKITTRGTGSRFLGEEEGVVSDRKCLGLSFYNAYVRLIIKVKNEMCRASYEPLSIS